MDQNAIFLRFRKKLNDFHSSVQKMLKKISVFFIIDSSGKKVRGLKLRMLSGY